MPENRAIGIDDGGGVVIEAGGALFEKRGDDDDSMFFGELAKRIGAGAGDRLGQLEKAVVFDLAEILRAEQFLRADDFCAGFGGALDQAELVFQVRLAIRPACHLGEGDRNDVIFGFGLFSLHRILPVLSGCGCNSLASDNRNRSTFSAASPTPVLVW